MKGTTKCQCGCGKDIEESLSWILQSLERDFKKKTGKELVITSGARCQNHNKKVGGSNNSAHKRGQASDISYSTGNELYVILEYLFANDIKRIGVNFEKHFVHFDLGTLKDGYAQKTVFKY